MKIAIVDIEGSPRELAYTETVEELNDRLGSGARDYRVAEGLEVDLTYYRSGLDVFFQGSLRGTVLGSCARCLEEYAFDLEHPFVFVLTPRVAAGAPVRLSAEDMALSYYDGEEIDVTPLVYEQAILALPTRPLCAEGCRGLCPRCGANLNAGPCGCPAGATARPAALHGPSRGK
jgi:uncharacterized protein